MIVALVMASQALACGGLFAPEGVEATAPAVEVIYEPGDGFMEVTYRGLFVGAPGSVGWVIPIPGDFVSLEDADPARFDRFKAETGPDYDLDAEAAKGCKKEEDTPSNPSGDVRGAEVVQSDFAGTYDYAVIHQNTSQLTILALLDWLGAKGFDPGVGRVNADHYASDTDFDWRFVCIGVTGAAEGSSLPPIVIRYAGDAANDKMIWPARMMSSSSSDEIHTTVYIVGHERARAASGWLETEIGMMYLPEDPDPAGQLTQRLRDLGAQRQFATIFSGPTDDGWLTRYEAITAPADYAADVRFELDSGVGAEVHTLVNDRTGCDAPEDAWFLLLPPMFWVGRRRRK